MDKIKTFIESDIYNSVLNKVEDILRIEVNKKTPPITMLNYDLSLLKASNLSIEAISSTISVDDKVCQFIISKIVFYRNREKEDNNEYPEGENLDEDELPITREVLPYYKDFMFSSLIENCLLKSTSSELFAYLRKTRMPHAKKYEKELREIYSKL